MYYDEGITYYSHSPFIDMNPNWYWTSNKGPAGSNSVWIFNFVDGSEAITLAWGYPNYLWAVRDGDVPPQLGYTIAQITPDGVTAKQPAISDDGEIVWLQYRPTHSEQDWEVFSNLRGQVTDVPGSVNEPEIGNNGEIIWTVSVGDGFPNPDYHTHKWGCTDGDFRDLGLHHAKTIKDNMLFWWANEDMEKHFLYLN